VQRIRYSLLVVVLALFPSPTTANNEEFPLHSVERSGTPQFKNCKANAQGMGDEALCLEEEYHRQIALLDLAFNELLTSVTTEQQSQIRLAQKAWTTFRDENCKVRMLNGGSGSPIFYFGCLARETITRRAEISELWDY
jgi:uncharacterized protein YecT (DUF1311 family)